MKVHIQPRYRGPDEGDGGIRRIVEAQHRWLPELGVEVVEDIHAADLVATHAGVVRDMPVGKPWVVHTHGLYWAEYRWARWAYGLNGQVIDALKKADAVSTPSEWVAQSLRRGMWLRPTVLPHGIDTSQWETGANAGYVLWNKTRPDPICDPRPLNDLAALMPDTQFVTTFGAKTANVRVVGRVPFEEMTALVRNAGVYLCTTRETFGIGTLEAIASGVPVVGWAWGGQRDIIRHGETGWLAAPGDTEGLEEGVRWALDHRAEIAGKALEDIKERFNWPVLMQRYVDLYEATISRKRKFSEGSPAPRISVIVPCHNLAHYLPDAIKSLQAQTVTDWEAVIVDDASPDETARVAAELAHRDTRVRVVTNETNLYLAGALNAGIEASRGRYVLPLDADNMLAPETLDLLGGALDGDRGVDIAYGAAQFVLEDGVTPDSTVAPDGISKWPTEFGFANQMLHHNQIPSTSMYRREAWERSGGYRKRCRTAEDAEFWTRAVSLGFTPRKVTDHVTLIYRQRTESMSRVEADWDWTAWFPWSRQMDLTPFGASVKPPTRINQGFCWNVPSYEPAKVTVVIPVGPGHQDLLIDALDSVEAQTYRRWECIVVNDTGEALNVPHPWARVLETDGGAGPAKARNMAIEVSTAPLFVPLDADDYLQADALAELIATWTEFGGVVYSQWWDDLGEEKRLYDPPDYDARLLTQKGAIHAVTALYPKSGWKQVGGFDENLSHWEDWDFLLALAKVGICGTKVPRPLFTYRKNTGFRREENHASFPEGKQAILDKWSALWEGKEELMACSKCPGGGGGRYPKPPAPAAQQSNANGARQMAAREGYVILEYQGSQTGTRTYRGKQTGTTYRFGSNPAHKRKYVYEKDMQELLEIQEAGQVLFVNVSPTVPEVTEGLRSSPTMDAAGPPASMPEQGADQGLSDLSVKQIRSAVAHMSHEELQERLTSELSGANRKTAIIYLEVELRSRDAARVPA